MSNNPQKNLTETPLITVGQIKTLAGRLAMAIRTDIAESVAEIWVNGKPGLLSGRLESLMYRPARIEIHDQLFWKQSSNSWIMALLKEGLVTVQNQRFDGNSAKPADIALVSNEEDHKRHVEQNTPVIIKWGDYFHYSADDLEWLMRRKIHEIRDRLKV